MFGVNESTKGVIAPFLGAANLPEKVSRNTGYRSDSIALSRDMGPLSMSHKGSHYHRRSKIIWQPFLASKKDFQTRPVVDTKITPKNQGNHIYNGNLSSLAPIFLSARKSSSLEQGGA